MNMGAQTVDHGHQFGPVDNSNLRDSAEVARVAIYRRAKQLHALALAGANLSGEAMVQAARPRRIHVSA